MKWVWVLHLICFALFAIVQFVPTFPAYVTVLVEDIALVNTYILKENSVFEAAIYGRRPFFVSWKGSKTCFLLGAKLKCSIGSLATDYTSHIPEELVQLFHLQTHQSWLTSFWQWDYLLQHENEWAEYSRRLSVQTFYSTVYIRILCQTPHSFPVSLLCVATVVQISLTRFLRLCFCAVQWINTKKSRAWCQCWVTAKCKQCW